MSTVKFLYVPLPAKTTVRVWLLTNVIALALDTSAQRATQFLTLDARTVEFPCLSSDATALVDGSVRHATSRHAQVSRVKTLQVVVPCPTSATVLLLVSVTVVLSAKFLNVCLPARTTVPASLPTLAIALLVGTAQIATMEFSPQNLL